MSEPLPETLERLGHRCAALFTVVRKGAQDETRPQLDDLISRFKIWAGNIGLFASGRAGIDHRFESDIEARDVLFSMLISLSKALQRMMPSDPSASEKQAKCSTADRHEQESKPEGPIDSSSEESSLDEDSTADSADEGDLADAPAIRVAEEVINQLYRFLKLVKSSGSSEEYAKVVNFASRHCDKEEDAAFGSWIRFTIKREMPVAADYFPALVNRLTNAALYRRWKMLYKQEHARKLRSNIEDLLPSQPGALASEINTSASTIQPVQAPTLPTIVVDNVTPAQPRVSFVPASHTEASVVRKLAVPLSTKSAAPSNVTPSGVIRRGKLDIPPAPPPEKETSREVVCPYCTHVIRSDLYGTSRTDKARWARHVVRDSSPYVCLFDDCTESLTMQYSTQDEWMQHMLWSHAQSYSCKAAGHQDEVFGSEDAFRAHLSKYHTMEISTSEVDGIVSRAVIPREDLYQALQSRLEQSLEEDRCILCGHSISESKPSLSRESLPHLHGMTDAIRNHLASHLEGLALLSLPVNEDAGSGAADSCASADSPTSKAMNFEGLPPVRPCNSFENVFEDPEYIKLLQPRELVSELRPRMDGWADTPVDWSDLMGDNTALTSQAAYDWQNDSVLLRFSEARKERSIQVLKRWRNAIERLRLPPSQPTIDTNADGPSRKREPFSTVPFGPDPDFVDRPEVLAWIRDKCAGRGARAALVGLGGVGYVNVHSSRYQANNRVESHKLP
ncbi:hypothetical protein K469DRAFT_610458 [Zopfia rhizophila CBS 207.26]|uniref:C2H2-type domain-containing protein n=1 Tax=Zopfia rhizophila CBS 207.26 TaxID=1314779 RepID=A0A6A6D7L7_9PEZI|nr:hypothetical protein K469DRAFT_610458 [Zopfia rhizophila CBS 207.26]